VDRINQFGTAVAIGQSSASKGNVSTRVRRIRRGAAQGVEVLPDEAEALWCPTGGPRTRVVVLLELDQQVISGEGIELSLGELTVVGTLDRSPRPRAVNSHYFELDSGVVLRMGDGLATLLMCKANLAVLAILAGWPAPNVLPHGQSATDITTEATT
jgi:hypothetical protein